jgi:hypothetical protein
VHDCHAPEFERAGPSVGRYDPNRNLAPRRSGGSLVQNDRQSSGAAKSRLPKLRESQRPRAGRMFAPIGERELELATRRALRSLPGIENGVVALREAAGPFGVPDVLAVVGDRAPYRARLRLPIPPILNEIDAAIVGSLGSRAGLTRADLAARVGWDESTLSRRLPALLRLGAVIETKSGRLRRPAELASIGSIYAIEAKIRDWRRALVQCRTYRLWTNNYVLVLGPLSSSPTASVLHEVRKDRGGLVVGDASLRPPSRRRLSAQRQFWGSEYAVAAMTAGVTKPTLRYDRTREGPPEAG